MTTDGFASFTEEENAIDYLEKTISFIKAAISNPLDWKWAVLAVDGAAYNFMICALKGTNAAANVCEGKTGKLIGFYTALSRCRDTNCMASSGFRNVLQITAEQEEALRRIHDEFRNQFTHYTPTCWAFPLSLMPEIIGLALDTIRFVSLEMGCYYVHYGQSGQEKILRLLSDGKRILSDYALSLAH